MKLCMVSGCPSDYAKSGIVYYRLPDHSGENIQARYRKLSEQRMSAWLAAVGVSHAAYKYIRNKAVCSLHFVKGKPAKLADVDDVDWTPSLKLISRLVPTPTCISSESNGANSPFADYTCRGCSLVSPENVSIFDIDTNELTKDAELLSECLEVSIAFNDEYPSYICKLCKLQLSEFYHFKQSVQRMHRHFTRKLGRHRASENATRKSIEPPPPMANYQFEIVYLDDDPAPSLPPTEDTSNELNDNTISTEWKVIESKRTKDDGIVYVNKNGSSICQLCGAPHDSTEELNAHVCHAKSTPPPPPSVIRASRYDREDDERIIEFVRQNECTFNKSHPKYGRHRLWTKLAQSMSTLDVNRTSRSVRRRFEVLKENYFNRKRTFEHANTYNASTHQDDLQFLESMSFLSALDCHQEDDDRDADCPEEDATSEDSPSDEDSLLVELPKRRRIEY